MSLIERYVAAFNAGDVAGALASTTEDYVYADPTSGELDRTTNAVLMEQVLAAFPDRWITLSSVITGPGYEFAEGTWHGTPAAGGEPLTVSGTVVVEVEVDGDAMSAQRWLYDPPPGGFLSADETGDRRVATVGRFLDLLVAHQFDRWAQLWAVDAEVRAPFAPEGFPDRLAGRDLIVAAFGQLFQRYGRTRFVSRQILPTIDSTTVIGRWRADMEVVDSDDRYVSDVISVFEIDGDLIGSYTEYFNPDRVRAARSA